jgi:hypothetical protein
MVIRKTLLPEQQWITRVLPHFQIRFVNSISFDPEMAKIFDTNSKNKTK